MPGMGTCDSSRTRGFRLVNTASLCGRDLLSQPEVWRFFVKAAPLSNTAAPQSPLLSLLDLFLNFSHLNLHSAFSFFHFGSDNVCREEQRVRGERKGERGGSARSTRTRQVPKEKRTTSKCSLHKDKQKQCCIWRHFDWSEFDNSKTECCICNE